MLHELNVKSIICNFIDVFKQKLNELELTRQSVQITERLETMTDGFIFMDENLCYDYVNGQAL